MSFYQSTLKITQKALLISASLCCLGYAPYAQAQTDELVGLGDLPGGPSQSYAYGISADGSVVVGSSTSASGNEAFRWTSGGGMVGLGDLAGGSFESYAFGINADGSVIVGTSDNGSASGEEAFRWTSGGGMVGLGTLPGGILFLSNGLDVSADGLVIVGLSVGTIGFEAFRWTSGGGMVGLGDLAGGAFSSRANGVSADGSVVVGYGTSASGLEAFRWTSGGGMVGLGDLAGGAFSSGAFGVSADGSVIIGQGTSASGLEAFRWTSGGGMVGLGDLAGGSFSSQALDVNADGSVIVGLGTSASGQEAFRWTASDGMQSVEDWLADAGVGLGSFTILSEANDVSADGTVIVGQGQSPSGFEAFLARVSPIGSGILDITSVNQSLVSAQELPTLSNQILFLALHGAHHRPLMMQDNLGKRSCVWATTDGGYYSRDREGYMLNQEVGGCHDFIDDRLRLGVGVGIGKSHQDTFLTGSQELKGQYGLVEANYRPENTSLIFGLTGLAGIWNADVNRGYLNAGTPDISKGETDITSGAIKASIHWQNAAQINLTNDKTISLSPKIIYTHTRTEVDGFTEIGGGFPIRFDEQTMTSRELRAGVEAETKINQDKTTLRATAEAVHRFNPNASGVSGNLVGLFSFDIEDNQGSDSWARGGVEIEHRFENNIIIGSSLFASTTGQDPDISGALNLQMPF